MRKPKPTGQKRPTKIQAIYDSIIIDDPGNGNNNKSDMVNNDIRGMINNTINKRKNYARKETKM